jgi:hypothetical protein
MKPPLPPNRSDESVDVPPESVEAPPEVTAAANEPNRVTKVTGDLTLVPPNDCYASVLLKMIDSVTGNANPRLNKRIFASWLMAGRHGLKAMKADYKHDGVDTIRIDVPDGKPLCTSYLQQVLRDAWEKEDPTLPPDTPVVKG